MNLIAWNILLTLLVLFAASNVAGVKAGSMILMDPELPLKKCRYFRSLDLFQVQCKDLKLNDIPPNLQSGIEVLEARENRIRELRNDSLSRYTSLRYLYLQDNFITKIAENAFAPTYYLEVLELSKNGLHEIPRNFFQLPYLRNLYLNENQLHDTEFNDSNIQAPLYWLHVSGNKLTRLPRLHPLTNLNTLNVSKNEITRITARDIAPLCSLKVLDLTGNPISFDENTCECYEFKNWITFRNIKLAYTFECPTHLRERCSRLDFSNRTMTQYSQCMALLNDRIEAGKARTTWIWIASCLGCFIACIFIALCYMHRRNKNRRQRLKEQNIIAASGNEKTEQLLNKEVVVNQEQELLNKEALQEQA